MKFSKIALAITTLLVSGSVLAHGYISSPPSRDTMCQLGMNKGELCSNAQYEPQSVGESPKGFPAVGTPPDGKLVSTGKALGANLDAQTAEMWKKNKMTSGENDFSWHFTALHKTKNWKYFITKPDWNPNKPLTRDAFDLVPFCTVEGNQQLPDAADVTHKCVVPERSGYHVIYSSWEVSDTANSFYKAIDVEFEDTVVSPWPNKVGEVKAYQDLKAGDSVSTRVFMPEENVNESMTMKINSDAEGKAHAWAKKLAEKMNKHYGEDLRVGVKNAEGEVAPSASNNVIYAKKDSKITGVEIEVVSNEGLIQTKLEVDDVKKEYPINNQTVTFDVTGTSSPKSEVTASLYTKGQKQADSKQQIVDESGKFDLAIEGTKVKPGEHTLVVISKSPKGLMKQQTFKVNLTENAGGGESEAEFTYPKDIGKYVGGTTVLQPKNGKVYQCKDGAVAGWCKIYSQSANHYEPGVGSNWQDAWTEVGAAKKSH
ncbi:N-acetylglucosamine-binding protein GbpA [Erwinia piriflorinigrans]|uniref:GlcNac-binding protein A n=1 Tax=Erwinia piriflorinigrans CFBP 5888 TaxID=1161919 RepID=V5ZBI8_9GAMM|nr:N-acetylglucosamine-binding protein GbpA [Erwinia piriflorinigrans]CCG88281.1 GlcNac-binding protein A precursor [Erwinia piriflorinigrans CFBP 5888]